MPAYTFKTAIGEYIIVEVDGIDEALFQKAGINKYGFYEIVETDDFERNAFQIFATGMILWTALYCQKQEKWLPWQRKNSL